MAKEKFDAVIIGSGQGGTPLSLAAAEHGWKTALIERRYLGGVCTNDGCTPTKTMIASARVAALARRGKEYGVQCENISVDLHTVKQRVEPLSVGGRHQLEKKIAGQQNLEVIYGEASFAPEQAQGSAHTLQVRCGDGSVRLLDATRVFVDTGERPQLPTLEGLGNTPYLDSSSILQLETVPEHLVLLGGGYIAVEFAQMFRRFGSEVTILQHGPQLMDQEDEDIAACLAEILREDGIRILLNAKATRVSGREGSVSVIFEGADGPGTVAGSHLLIATGRVPNTEALHVEHVGVALTEKSYIQVNERLETSVPGIWALGDVTGGPPYTHISYDDFRILRANLLEGGSRSTRDRLVPYAIFTDPELGRVGLTEKQARQAGRSIRVAVAPMRKVARAAEMAETRGMMKAIVDRDTDQLLGAAILGLGGGEVATQLQLAMLGKLPATQLRECIFVHPVLAEGLHLLFRSYRTE